jgi:hypothetical protein
LYRDLCRDKRDEPSTSSPSGECDPTAIIDEQTPLQGYADSEADDDDMFPSHLLPPRRRKNNLRIDSDDESGDDCGPSETGTAPPEIPQNEDDDIMPDDNTYEEEYVPAAVNPLEIATDVAEHAPTKIAHPSPKMPLVAPQDSDDKPMEVSEQDKPTAPSKRTRTAVKLLNIGGCDICGKTIAEAEKSDRTLVAECSKRGCETRWVGYLRSFYSSCAG